MIRGNLATVFDSLFPAAGAGSVEPQVLLDMLLLELDRGIDLLALDASPDDRGPMTHRAVAYWLIVRVILNLVLGGYIDSAKSIPAGYTPSQNGPFFKPTGPLNTVLTDITTTFGHAYSRVPTLESAFVQYVNISTTQILPITDRMFLEAVLEELRVQESLEDRWRNLIRTVAPEAGDQESVFGLLKQVIKQAQQDAIGTGTAPPRIPYEQRLPPQYEQSLAEIVRNTRPS